MLTCTMTYRYITMYNDFYLFQDTSHTRNVERENTGLKNKQ